MLTPQYLRNRHHNLLVKELVQIVKDTTLRGGRICHFRTNGGGFLHVHEQDFALFQNEHIAALDPKQGDFILQQQLSPERVRALKAEAQQFKLAELRLIAGEPGIDPRSPKDIADSLMARLRNPTAAPPAVRSKTGPTRKPD